MYESPFDLEVALEHPEKKLRSNGFVDYDYYHGGA